MWAGGSFEWPVTPSDSQEPQGILVGSSVSEETSVEKIEAKAGMVFVHQLKEYKSLDAGRTLLKEVRMHVFRPSLEATGSEVKASTNPSSKFYEPLKYARLTSSQEKRRPSRKNHSTYPSHTPLPFPSSSASQL
jgi:hypothetical protein